MKAKNQQTRWVWSILLLFTATILNVSFSNVRGSSYYFSAKNGSDSNTGTTSISPWKSLSKLQSTINSLQAGDIIYLERGSVWYEARLSMNSRNGNSNSPVKFSAYGSGARPVLSGGRNVSGTFSSNGNTWTSSSVGFIPHGYVIIPGGILIDNKFFGISRHPNETYYTTQTRGYNNYLADNSQSWTSNGLVGGQVVARCVTWAWSAGTITSNTSNTINFQSFPDFSLGTENETTHYFLQNIEQGLDLNGEWCFNNNDIKVYSAANLNAKTVEFSVVDTILKVNNCNYIKFEGIEFRMANAVIMDIQNGSNFQIADCNFRVAGFTAIDVNSTPNFDVTNNSFEYIHGNGITADNLNVSHINGNHFFMSPGTRGHWNFTSENKRVGASVTTYYHTGPVYVMNNEFDSVMIAMQSHWSDAPFYFERNIVRNYGVICGDIAAVYMGGDWKIEIKKYIRKNIFIDAHENTQSTIGAHPARYVHGIYWDYDVHGAVCDSNTFINTNAVVYSNKAYGNRFNGNVVYNGAMNLQELWATNIYLDANFGGQAGPKLDTFKYNTFVMGQNANERPFLWHNITEGGFDVNHNTYVSPFNSNTKAHREVDTYSETGNYSVSEYCSRKGFDCNTTFNPIQWNYNSAASLGISKEEFVNVVYNATNSPAYKQLDAEYIDLNGNIVRDSVLIGAYYSKVLFYHGAVNHVNHAPVLNDRLVEINENEFSGTTVCDLNATDSDNGQSLTYSITAGNPDDIFQIQQSTGILSFTNSEVNFTSDPVYALTVRTTDNGSPALSDNATVTVKLFEEATSVNHAPVINTQSFHTSYDAVLPASLGLVLATDEDEDQELTYTIITGNPEGYFTLDPITGELLVIGLPSNQVPMAYNLLVSVEDNVSYSLSAEAVVTVLISASELVYFIDPENVTDPSSNGSFDHPYTSWSQVEWKENSSYLQKRGTTAIEDKILITANNVTIADYGTGDKPVISSTTSEYAIKVMEKYNILIKNLKISADAAIGCVYFLGAACENNSIENCEMLAADYGLRIIDGKSYTVKYNLFMNDVDGIYSIADDAEIFYNIFKANHKAINLSSYSSSAKIYNNVFYDNRQGVSTSYAEVTLFNNIFYLTQASDQAINHKMDKLVSNNNIFFPEQEGFLEIEEVKYNTLTDYQTEYGFDLNSFSSDPLFVDIYDNNFAVTQESFAIDAGRIVGLTQDFLGQTVPCGGAPDVGLVETSAAATTWSPAISGSDADKGRLSVFPNPTDGRFTLTFDNERGGLTKIIINSLTGNQLYSMIFDSEGLFFDELDLSDSPKGLYYLSVISNNNIFTEKLLLE